MDTKDLVILFAGALIGFVTSILANWSTDSFWRVLTRSRAGLLERSKKRAFLEYKELKSLRNGERDRNLYFIEWSMRIQIFFLTGFFGWVLGTTLSLLPWILSLLLGLGCLTRALSYWLRLTIWRERLDDFSRYESDLRQRHGELPG
jgi:hypothetical protein